MALSRLHPLALALLSVFLAAPGRAADDDPTPRLQRRGGVLEIPGLPPIQLPPGARVFGPNGPGVLDEPVAPGPRGGAGSLAPSKPTDGNRDRANERSRAARIAPHSTPTIESQRARVLDDLFARLKDAEDEEDAKSVAAAIERVWLKSGSDTADLLVNRAAAAMAAKDTETATSLLGSVVEIEPNWAEGWNKRATLRFLSGDIDGAMADIDHVLKLEPRHFGALTGLGAILQKVGFDKRALEAYRRALAIYPQQPEIRKAVEKLQIEVEGRDI